MEGTLAPPPFPDCHSVLLVQGECIPPLVAVCIIMGTERNISQHQCRNTYLKAIRKLVLVFILECIVSIFFSVFLSSLCFTYTNLSRRLIVKQKSNDSNLVEIVSFFPLKLDVSGEELPGS